jgi:hypothetical protein
MKGLQNATKAMKMTLFIFSVDLNENSRESYWKGDETLMKELIELLCIYSKLN